MQPCRHCRRIVKHMKRGLCNRCWNTPAIFDANLPLGLGGRPCEHDEPDEEKPARQPGDASCRCLWCQMWRCDDYLEMCLSCQQEYDEASVGMPAKDYERGVKQPKPEKHCSDCGRAIHRHRLRRGVCRACQWHQEKYGYPRREKLARRGKQEVQA